MEISQIAERIPQWIWHADRHGASRIELTRTFVLAQAIKNVEFRIALTGSAEVEIDGVIAGRVEESAGNVCAFQRIASFPECLDTGAHTIRLRIACSVFMPTAPVNIHLHERTVGCVAYLAANEFWLRTDESWSANGEGAVKVCLLGEEPFGDLEDGLDWFVAGGFGDIAVSPISGCTVSPPAHMEVSSSGEKLRVTGNGRGICHVPVPARQELQIFYHVRKQAEWLEMNQWWRSMDRSALPSCVIDLGKEYNARFQLHNPSQAALIVIWNGAESLEELEHYAGLMTEVIRLEPGQTRVTLPQGLRYLRMTILAAEGEPYEVEWCAEEAAVPLNQAGTINTDSDLLQRIYDISLHTNRICHQIGLWDGIKRDRLNWTYDFYLAAKADYVLWDDLTVLRRSIEELGRGTPEGSWMNDIPAYTLWWINNIWEYYLHTGDEAFVLSLQDELMRHSLQVAANIDAQTEKLAGFSFTLMEWVSMDAGEASLGMQALLRLTGENIGKLKSYIPGLVNLPAWRYPDIPGEQFLQGEQLITPLLGILSGYVKEAEAKRFLQGYTVADPITPLSAYWLAECCSRLGYQDKAWEAISRVWGTMLKEGATTCWESVTLEYDGDFHDALTTYTAYDSYRISLCHSWAGTPVHWIVSRVLGVVPVEPGYRTIAFHPQPIEGISTCWGTLPTPYGAITAGWDKTASEPFMLQVPEGVQVDGL
ncbi:alpha-L-rhamnosidase C-terminal domain-containing protein [Paenibacillus sp. FSL K6-1096]|uniref:alpha-L-rhamnosidase-related protein n=1 Tax=Paenibacillus sp. FSL K6-1096 TaxID=2921460 RepID=UPI0030EBB24C